MEAAHSDDRDALRAKLAEAEARIKEWTENENGENYDFQIQGLLLRQTVEERDEARSRAEAAEAKLEIAINATATQVDAMLAAKLEAAEAEVAMLKSGIHPAKNPMEGGFSLDKFMPNVSPEDATALGEFLDEMQQRRYIHGYRTGREHNYSNNSKLIDHLESENQRLQAEVARLTITQEPLFSQRVLVPKLEVRIAALEAGLREIIGSIDAPTQRAMVRRLLDNNQTNQGETK